MKGNCVAIGTAVDRPVPLPFHVCHIGNQEVNFSHRLRTFRGLLFCSVCGALSQKQKLGNLAYQCSPPGEYGKRNIKYLNQGKLPPGLVQWPDECPDTDDSTVRGCSFQHMIAGTDFSQEEARAMRSLAVEYNRILAEQVSPSAGSIVAVSHTSPLSETPAYVRSSDDSGSD